MVKSWDIRAVGKGELESEVAKGTGVRLVFLLRKISSIALIIIWLSFVPGLPLSELSG